MKLVSQATHFIYDPFISIATTYGEDTLGCSNRPKSVISVDSGRGRLVQISPACTLKNPALPESSRWWGMRGRGRVGRKQYGVEEGGWVH